MSPSTVIELPNEPHKTNKEDIGEVIKKATVKKKSFQFVISNFRTAQFWDSRSDVALSSIDAVADEPEL